MVDIKICSRNNKIWSRQLQEEAHRLEQAAIVHLIL